MRIHVLFIVCPLIFSSCKKSNNTPASGGSQNSNTQPYGELTVLRSYSYNQGTGTLSAPMNTAYANFRTDLNNISSMIQIGGVWANGTKLKYESSSKTYADSTYSLNIVPTTWQVTGAATIPSFTYTNSDSLPGYTGYISLPDTIYKSQNLNLQVSGIGGADAIEVSFYNSSIPSTNIYQMRSTGISSTNSFSFSASALSPLPLSSSSTIMIISVFKHNSQFISGVNFRFANQLEIGKQVYIK